MVAYTDLFRLDPAPGWDEDIPSKENVKWLQILQEFCKASNVKFSRIITPIILMVLIMSMWPLFTSGGLHKMDPMMST